MEYLIQALRRTRNISLILGIFFLFFGGLMAWVILFLKPPELVNASLGGLIFYWFFMLLMTGLGFLFFIKAIRYWDPEETPLMKTVRECPDQIAWIYEQVFEGRYHGATVNKVSIIFIFLKDGKRHGVQTKKANVQNLLNYLSSIAPKAHVGYSSDIEKMYKKDPLSVLKS